MKGWCGMKSKPMFDRANFRTTMHKLQKYVLLLLPSSKTEKNFLKCVMEHDLSSTFEITTRDERLAFIYNKLDYTIACQALAGARHTSIRGNNDAVGQMTAAMEELEPSMTVFSDAADKSVSNPPLPLPTVICKQRAALLSFTSAWPEMNQLLALHGIPPLPQPFRQVGGTWTWVQFTEDAAADSFENRARANKVGIALRIAFLEAESDTPARIALAKHVLQVRAPVY
jgi:hypothetical protein